MKRGAKRLALSDSGPSPADSATLRSKRVVEASSLDVQRAESSRKPSLWEDIRLDEKRAELARHHVRALNTQFASWIQLQLQHHPDELWEDGLKDYLSHASHILENFKDVVDWLRLETAKNAAATEGLVSDNKKPEATYGNSVSILKSEVNDASVQEHRSSASQSAGFSNSHSLGPFSVNHTPSSSSSLKSSAMLSSQSSGLLSFSQKPSSSSFQSSGSLSSQNGAIFGINQSTAGPVLLSSGSSSSQPSGFSGFSQTLGSSGLPSFAFSSSESSGLFSNNKMPASSSLWHSESSGSLISGFASISQQPANSSLQSSGLSSSQGSGFFSFNQTSVFGGTQSSAAPKVEAPGDADEENEQQQPGSPSLQKTEEKGVIIVHEVKCKLYMKADNPADKSWKDMGLGQLSIKCKEGAERATKESKPTIIIRNDVGKILLNALIYPGIKTNTKKNTIATIFHTAGSEQNDGDEAGKSNVVTRMYLLRLKTEDDTAKLATAIQDYAPSA